MVLPKKGFTRCWSQYFSCNGNTATSKYFPTDFQFSVLTVLDMIKPQPKSNSNNKINVHIYKFKYTIAISNNCIYIYIYELCQSITIISLSLFLTFSVYLRLCPPLSISVSVSVSIYFSRSITSHVVNSCHTNCQTNSSFILFIGMARLHLHFKYSAIFTIQLFSHWIYLLHIYMMYTSH